MSVQSEIDRLTAAKEDSVAAVNEVGGDVSAVSTMSDLPAAIRSVTERVPVTRTVNGKALSEDISLTAEDVGALPDTYTAPVTSVNGQTGDVTVAAGGGMNAVAATLTTSEWVESSPYAYAQTVAVDGVTADASQCITVDVSLSTTDVDANTAMLEAWMLVAGCPAVQGDGTITFYATDTPTVAISLAIGVSG